MDYFSKSYSKETTSYKPERETHKEENYSSLISYIRRFKWGRGVLVAVGAMAIVIGVPKASKAIRADKMADALTETQQAAHMVIHDSENPDKVILGYSDEGLNETAKEHILNATYGHVNPHVLVASSYHEADYAKGYEDEIPTMDEVFKRTHALISGHEEDYPEEVVAVFNHPNFQSYLDANNISAKDYHKAAEKILEIASKYGPDSEQVNEFLDKSGFVNSSGGRK